MKKSYKNKHGLSKKETLIYGIANGGQVFGYSLVTSYLMYFYLNVFQVNAKIISAVFLIGGIWDIINNPLIGMMIDHKNNALGKQTEIIRHFTPLQCMVTILIFMGPIFIKSNSDTSLKNHLSCTNLFFMGILLFRNRCCFRGTGCRHLPEAERQAEGHFRFEYLQSAFCITCCNCHSNNA